MTAEVPGVPGVLVLLTDDLLIGRRLRQLAQANGLTLVEPGPYDTPVAGAPQPEVAVIDLQIPDALDRVRAWRARWPDTLVAAFLTEPDPKRWVAAQRAGADLVVNRGALTPRLRSHLAGRGQAGGGPRGRRYPLFEAADVAGRLGLVHVAEDSPVGPLAVYQVDGALHAVADLCPHAGAALSGGEVSAGVVTCPGHGSRFDVRTGERVRGPADADIACYQVAQEGGQVVLILRE